MASRTDGLKDRTPEMESLSILDMVGSCRDVSCSSGINGSVGFLVYASSPDVCVLGPLPCWMFELRATSWRECRREDPCTN